MKNNKFFLFLLLVALASACIVPAQLPALTATGMSPAVADTLSGTPAPPATFTPPPGAFGPGDTPAPTYTPPLQPTATFISHPALATSGPYLAYQRQEGDQTAIVLLDANGQGQKIIPYPLDASSENSSIPVANVLSPAGNWLAYYSGSAGQCFGNGTPNSGDLSLNLMSLADGKTRIVTSLLSKDYPNNFAEAARELNQADISAEMLQNAFVCGIMQSVAWSPDERFLAFAGQMDGLSSDLYLYDIAAGTIKRLSSGPQELGWISWSPDGKWILDGSSYSIGEGTKYSVYATSVDGTSVKLLPNTGPIGWLNNQMYFSSKGDNGPGSYDLTLFNIVTGKTEEIWNGSYGPFAFIPDGNWVAVYANTPVWPYPYNSDFQTGIFLVNLTSLHQTRVNSLGLAGCCLGTAISAFDSGENRMFLVKDNTDQSLDYLSTDGTLTPSGVQADKFSVSPDRRYWVAITTSLQVFSADGSSILTANLPANLTGQGIGSIIWRPDDSGLFFTYQDPKDYNSPGQLYALDGSKGVLELVDSLSPGWLTDFLWVGATK